MIIPIRIYPVKSSPFWTFAHVSKEIPEIQPSVTDCHTNIVFAFFTARLHAHPTGISFTPWPLPIMSMPMLEIDFSEETTTGASISFQ
jgi:hypothetical protein